MESRSIVFAGVMSMLLCTIGVRGHAGMGKCAQAYENSIPQSMPGQYNAQCTEKGHYQVIQRHGSTGYSWCVDPINGVKIEGSDNPPTGEVQCPACLTQLGKMLEGPAVGAYRPQCDAKTGNFKQVQVHASTGLAWCADPETGKQLSAKQRNDGTLKCDARNKRHAGMGRCVQQYENAMPQVKPGEYRAQCTQKGHYQVLQRHGSTGYSWCVDPIYGVKIEGSDVGPGAEASCPACLTQLAKTLEGPAIGSYKPQCDAKTGNYKQVQIHASTGLAWCADAVSGKQLTAKQRNDGTLKCDDFVSGVAKRSVGRCQLEAQHSSGFMGAYTPKCTNKGNYELIQHHASSGYSFCVDPVSGVKIESTAVGPAFGQPQCPACVTQLSKSLDLIGSYRPQCDTNGNFKSVQVHASTGLAWCADPATGKQLTEKQRNDGTLKC